MTIQVDRILAPIDFSENTPPILEWAAHLAEEHGAAITLLHAYHLPAEFQHVEGAYLPPDFWTAVKREAEVQLEDAATPLRRRGLSVEIAAVEGYAATVIVQEAHARHTDLVVIGTHGRSGLRHLLLGSIAERVVQKAHCPVLTVRAEDD